MKLHGIMLVKNEADIVEFALDRAAVWAERIYVFDTGSTDDTWARVQNLAKRCPAIVPYRSAARDFRDELRGEVFNAFRHEAGPGAWWCRLDADEVYAEDPRAFLADVPGYHHVVWAAHLQFYFTPADVARFPHLEGERPTIDETNRPRYYLNNSSEARFFRHRSRLRWDDGSWPRHLGLVHPRRIPLRHFQYRSPQQIQLRLDTRRQAARAGYQHFGHSLQTRWQEQVRDAAGLHYDDGQAPLRIDETQMPRHLERPGQRILKRILHGTGIWP
jgi:hypothetical protein